MKALGEALRSAILITHGGQQDIRLLHRDLEIRPASSFDTHCCWVLGLQIPLGLQALCSQILDHDISVETLTDWSKRPLDEDQIRYAAEDARFYSSVQCTYHRSQERNVENHMWQACEEMVEQQLLPPAVGLSWVHWGVAETLTLDAQRVLTALLEWREQTAMRKNQSPIIFYHEAFYFI